MSNHEKVDALLQELDQAKGAQKDKHAPTLQYVKKYLKEMSNNDEPLPDGTPDKLVWYIYIEVLQQEIDSTIKSPTARKDKIRATINVVSPPNSVSDDSESESDEDLASYAPNKRFAVKTYQKRKKSKKKRKRKRSKKRKRKRKRSTSSSSSDSETESTSSDDEETGSNAKRVRTAAYDGTHQERLAEFRQEYKEFHDDGKQTGWPSDDAIQFIAKRYARPGTKFASKGNQGVKRKFAKDWKEKEHARTRTNQLYDMADVAACIRQERHEKMAAYSRRKKGASQAKKARLKQTTSKFNEASVREEQTLVARISVYCDLVLKGSKSWEKYHARLKLGGQREAVVESLGGGVSKAVAAQAWKDAEKFEFKVNAAKAEPAEAGAIPRAQAVGGKKCYWCNKKGHQGRNCPAKKNGTPYYDPKSRAASWPENNKAKSGIKIQKGKKE